MRLWLILIFITSLCHAKLEDHFRKIEHRNQCNPIEHIDFIYLINLDRRPDRLQSALAQLAWFGISPCRFPAVDGLDLSADVLNDIGLKFSPGMQMGVPVKYVSADGNWKAAFPDESFYGKTCFYQFTNQGAIGCTLSHLSVLQDAYDAGYETIWVLEDDLGIYGHPQFLSERIEELDRLVGKEGWDILYTDLDSYDGSIYVDGRNDFQSDLKGSLHFLWRPDRSFNDTTSFRKRTILSNHILQIGSRARTHSMVIRRLGIRKILEFEKRCGIYTNIDHEIALVPGIRLFSLRYPLISFFDSVSDIAWSSK